MDETPFLRNSLMVLFARRRLSKASLRVTWRKCRVLNSRSSFSDLCVWMPWCEQLNLNSDFVRAMHRHFVIAIKRSKHFSKLF
jgi:hypothetical protein